MGTIIGLVFLLFALGWTIQCFFPGWRASPAVWSFAFSFGQLILWLLGLVVLYIIYLIVLALLGMAALPGLG